MIDLALLFRDEAHFTAVGTALGMVGEDGLIDYTNRPRTLTAAGLDGLSVAYPPKAVVFFDIPFRTHIKIVNGDGVERQHDGDPVTDPGTGETTQPTKLVSYRVNIRVMDMPEPAESFLIAGLITTGILIAAKRDKIDIQGTWPAGGEMFA